MFSNYGARLYDPVIGRFITPDTIIPDVYDPQSLNRYSYCMNNPLIYTDPDGMTCFGQSWATGLSGAIWGGLYGYAVGLGHELVGLICGKEFSFDRAAQYGFTGMVTGFVAGAILGCVIGDPTAAATAAIASVGTKSLGKAGIHALFEGIFGAVLESFYEAVTKERKTKEPSWAEDSLEKMQEFNEKAQQLNSEFEKALWKGKEPPEFSIDIEVPDLGGSDIGNISSIGKNDGRPGDRWGNNTCYGGTDNGGDKGSDKGGTVLCTVLHRQGILHDEIYQADSHYAEHLDPLVVAGYRLWARPLAQWMSESKILTTVLTPFIRAWAYHMAYKMGVMEKDNLLGSALEYVGVPICRMIGKYIVREDGMNHIKANYIIIKQGSY